MNAMTKTKLALSLGLLASVAAGCGAPNLCGDHYHDGYVVRCEPVGNATLVAPAHWGLPDTVVVKDGGSCLDDQGGCTSNSYVTLDSNPSDDGTVPRPRIFVQMFFPATTGDFSYVVNDQNPGNVVFNADIATNPMTREALDVVDGTIAVHSASPEQVRVSFKLTLRVPSTGEILTLSSATAGASCELESARICDDSLNVPYGNI